MKRLRHILRRVRSHLGAGLLAGMMGAGCGQPSGPTTPPEASPTATPARAPALRIVSGSENEALEPIVQAFARQRGVSIDMTYQGSVDISRSLQQGADCPFDAVWPASSLWLSLGDERGVVRHAESILRSPVVFAVKRPEAERLGWTGKTDVTISGILEAVERENLRFAMTSATQSNSGASWYLGCLNAFAGQPDVLLSEHLNAPELAKNIRRFLGRVNRTSGSSGWLKDLVVEKYGQFEGMVNYEALVIEANRELSQRGEVPLSVVYPVDGVTIADSPLGYVNKGDADKEKLFLELQEYLLSPDVQRQLLAQGRRTGRIGINPDQAAREVFRPEWGIDLDRVLSPVRTPGGPVVREALNLYQTAFRKPSLTAFVLDYSGSMKGEGEAQLEAAMNTLLNPGEAAKYLLQPSAEDLTLVLPFNSKPFAEWRVEGNDPAALRGLLRQITEQDPGGGTAMYDATLEALAKLHPFLEQTRYHLAVIVMSDGRSEGDLKTFESQVRARGLGLDIPVFTILFGQADPGQMKALAEWGGGRMFDGRKDVVAAFRKAKGYN